MNFSSFSTLLLFCTAAWYTTCTSYAGWWQDPALGNTRGAATGNEPILNSPYYNPNLPAGGLSPYAYNPALPYGGTALHLWRAPSGYYYPWGYGAYRAGFAYPVMYQSGRVVQASPPVTMIFNDMQSYLDESKSKGRLNENDYLHLQRRLHDLIGKSEEINGEGNNPDQDPDLQEDVKELNLDIAQRIKPAA